MTKDAKGHKSVYTQMYDWKEKGITLVALVITIIVLLILAGLSINIALGDNGLIQRAKDTKIEQRIAKIKEAAELIKGDYMLDNQTDRSPTSRYILEKLFDQDYIALREIVDYGDETAIGILNIENRTVYINGELEDTDLALRYEVEKKEGYNIIRLYPKVKESNTYGDYASAILYGKSEDELKQILVDGWNYWNAEEREFTASSFDQLVEYYYTWGGLPKKSINIDDFARDAHLSKWGGYPSAREMLISEKFVKPGEFTGDFNQNGLEINLYAEGEEDYPLAINTFLPYAEYKCSEEGNYIFKLQYEEDEISKVVHISDITELNYDNVIQTDGEGVIIGIPAPLIEYGGPCEALSKVSEITIPEYVGDERITAIEDGAFAHISGLTKVNIEAKLTSIGANAFVCCEDLSIINIPNTVTSIGENAFSACYSLTNITIPDSVTSIGYGCFSSCKDLTEITLSKNLNKIEGYTFTGCNSLTNVTIPNNVKTIGIRAFYNCKNLKNVSLPSQLEEIQSSAFMGCNSLTNLIIPNTVTYIGDRCFYDCNNLSSINIPNTVTSIESYTFYGCSSLTSVTIPNGVTNIGDYTFYDCNSLTSITIPNSVTRIGSGCFSGCSSLTSVTIPNGVTKLEWATFRDCTNLSNVVIPDGLTYIETDVFKGCTGLRSIYIPESVTTIKAQIRNAPFLNCSSSLVIYCGANSKPSGWGTYWNRYSSSSSLTTKFGYTRQAYEAEVNS